jgi:hypothetical protein
VTAVSEMALLFGSTGETRSCFFGSLRNTGNPVFGTKPAHSKPPVVPAAQGGPTHLAMGGIYSIHRWGVSYPYDHPLFYLMGPSSVLIPERNSLGE